MSSRVTAVFKGGGAKGDEVKVRADVARGVAFLDTERWSTEHWNAFPWLAVASFAFGSVFIDALHDLILRRQLHHAGRGSAHRSTVPIDASWPGPTARERAR